MVGREHEADAHVANALRETRWTQVFIELLLLVVGILIALAIDGWMQDRQDARKERLYLERLVRDFAKAQAAA